MQEAYVRAYTHLADYREQGNFAAWLTRIAVNEALMRKRKDRRFVPLDTPAAPDEEDTVHTDERFHTTTPEGLAGGGELRRLIENAVDRLPDGFRAVFVLRAIEQLSVNEVAACLDIPEATVRTRFHRAREMMRRDLDRHIDAAGLSAFDFAAAACDGMVATVLRRFPAPGSARRHRLTRARPRVAACLRRPTSPPDLRSLTPSGWPAPPATSGHAPARRT